LTAQLHGNDGWLDAAKEDVGRIIKGDILEFADWRWRIGSMVVQDGTRLAALSTVAYWQRWENQRSVEVIVREPRGVLPDRRELSHNDPGEWPMGLSGEPQDPWQNTRALYLADPKTAKMFTFPTSSMGGHGAINELSQQITRMRAARPGAIAIVELGSAEMRTRYGLRSKPAFPIVDWVGGEQLPPEIEVPVEAPRVVSAEAAEIRSRIHIESSPSAAKVEAKVDDTDDIPW
jgi:hypothetical protein